MAKKAPAVKVEVASMRPSLSGWVEASTFSTRHATGPRFNEAQPLGLGGGTRDSTWYYNAGMLQ